LIGQLNQANSDLCAFNGWDDEKAEKDEKGMVKCASVSLPNTWLQCTVKVNDKPITLAAWYDEHVANNDSTDEAE
jgi:hypothetical protein